MRKIEQETVSAIQSLIYDPEFSGVRFSKGNMIVEQNHHGIAHTPGYQRIISVRLHGNEIAAIRPAERTIWVSDCGWQTATTKSRINVILNEFARYPLSLAQDKGTWYHVDPSSGHRYEWKGCDTLQLA